MAKRPPRDKAKDETRDTPQGLSTRAVHGGTAPDPATGARITPVYQTASYVFEDADHAARRRGHLRPAGQSGHCVSRR